MIISALTDRLGNQLFQYATGKALAFRQNVLFKLDLSYYEWNKDTYELGIIFDINPPIVTKKELERYTWTKSDSLLYRLLRKIFPKYTYFEKKTPDPHFENLGDNVYLRGFWQSYKYFESIRGVLLDELKWAEDLDEINESISVDILNCNSVSLHIRRGDYVENKAITHLYNICNKNYYQKAIEHVINLVEKPRFFVFSDNIQWVKENINIDFPHKYIEHNSGNKSYIDMRLMSLCKHNIIANSSFSWWGAWLNQNSNKIVIAPSKWRADNYIKSQDVCPPNWLLIDL